MDAGNIEPDLFLQSLILPADIVSRLFRPYIPPPRTRFARAILTRLLLLRGIRILSVRILLIIRILLLTILLRIIAVIRALIIGRICRCVAALLRAGRSRSVVRIAAVRLTAVISRTIIRIAAVRILRAILWRIRSSAFLLRRGPPGIGTFGRVSGRVPSSIVPIAGVVIVAATAGFTAASCGILLTGSWCGRIRVFAHSIPPDYTGQTKDATYIITFFSSASIRCYRRRIEADRGVRRNRLAL